MLADVRNVGTSDESVSKPAPAAALPEMCSQCNSFEEHYGLADYRSFFTFECPTCGMSHTDGGHHNAIGDRDNA